jgi:hypothetical protein
MGRFLKIQKTMGPKTMGQVLTIANKLGATIMEGEPLQALTVQEVRESMAYNGGDSVTGEGGSLVLYLDKENVHAFHPLSILCRNAGLRTFTGDTKKQKPEDFGKTGQTILSPVDVVASAIEGSKGMDPAKLVNPSTYFCLVTSKNMDLAIKNCEKAKADLEKAKAVHVRKLDDCKPWLTPDNIAELANMAERMRTENNKATENIAREAASHPESYSPRT